ncbi:MAG: acyl-ACP--UDP-N-acetylglucosamine O-acyltransferase [Verrucomicrobiota bacterium]
MENPYSTTTLESTAKNDKDSTVRDPRPVSFHSTAIISPKAQVDPSCIIGPYCVIGPEVNLAPGNELISHVTLQGPSTIGPNNTFHPYASVGSRTQDLKYRGEPTYLEIGEGNTFRESCTINRGTGAGEKTIIGNHNHFLAYAHVAHNCQVGDHCVFSNNGTLAGHVIVGDYAVIGGLSAVHQFCRVGEHAMIGGCAKIVQDVPPFLVADGNPADIRAVNIVGLQRRGYTEEVIRDLKAAHKTLYNRELNTSQALEELERELSHVKEVHHLVEFVRNSQRGVIR